MRAQVAVSFVLVFLGGVAATTGRAAAGSSTPEFRGFAADVDAYHASSWTFTDPIDPYGDHHISMDVGLGLRLSYAVSPRFAPYAAVHLVTSDFGEKTGTTSSIGMQLRIPWTRRFMPFATAGIGHLSDPEFNVSYDLAEFGAGMQVFLSGRLALHPLLEFVTPLGDGEREIDGGKRDVELDVHPIRGSFGLTWFLGARSGEG